MLQSIRDRSQGLVVGVIVFFICLTFALFGVQEYLDAKSTVVVAEVDGEEITLTEFQRTFQQLRQRAQAMLGDAFVSEEWSGEQAKRSTLDYVVNDRLLQQVALRSNIRASNRQVARQIRTSPQFQEDGNFSQDLYSRMVRVIGFSELGFEEQIRKDIVTNQIRAGIGATAFVTDLELRRLEQYRQQTRDVGYAIIGIESFRDSTEPAREALEKYFAENAEDYRIDEKIAVSYLDLSIEALMAEVAADDAQLRAYYDTNQGNYTVQEQRNANHILVQVPRGATPEEEVAANTKALGLRERALGGEPFEAIAEEASDDVGSRMDGGETGFFGRGVMAPEFEQAVFSMSEGDVSDPVRTEFGFHVIRLKSVKPGGLKGFADAKADVEAAYKREQAEALFFEQAEQLSEIVYEQPDSLDAASEALGLPAKSTETIPRAELSELFSPRVVEAVFEPEVLVEGLNSEPIEVNSGRIVVVRLLKHEPSSLPKLEDVLTNVKTDLIDTTARDGVAAHGRQLVERLNTGEDLKTIVAAEELQWQDVGGATRSSAKLNRAVARAAFQLPIAEGDEQQYTGVPIGVGDFAVVKVSKATLPPGDQLNRSDLSQLSTQVSKDRSATSWRDFVALLKSDSKLEEFPDRF